MARGMCRAMRTNAKQWIHEVAALRGAGYPMRMFGRHRHKKVSPV